MKVPKLRFKDDKGQNFPEWEEKKLGDLCSTFKSGIGITSEKISDSGKFPVYGGNGLRGYTDTYTHDGFFVLIGRQGALCGNINRSFGKAYISEHAIAVNANETSHTDWLAHKFDYLKLNRLSESSAQPGLSVNKLIKIKLFVPSKAEQTKIANFLTAIDEKISQLTQKCDLLAQYKKGVMQQIFSQQIRFKDDDGREFPEWEEKKLGELGKFIGGGTPNTQNEDFWNGNIPWISSSDLTDESIFQIKITRFISESALSQSATKLVPKNSILIVSRVGVGKVAIAKEDICTSQDFTNLVLHSGNHVFFAYLIKTKTNKLLEFNQGTSIKGFVKSDLEVFEISVPCIPEQTKIANFLTAIDDKITHTQAQLAAMKQYKQGLLQQMFV